LKTIHVANRRSEETTKRARQGGTTEEKGVSALGF
jgi:hypothetical protein